MNKVTGLEICGRIVEGKVPVFAYTHDADRGIQFPHQLPIALKLLFDWLMVTMHAFECLRLHILNEFVLHPTPETCRVVLFHAEIFIHMQDGDAGPVDIVTSAHGVRET